MCWLLQMELAERLAKIGNQIKPEVGRLSDSALDIHRQPSVLSRVIFLVTSLLANLFFILSANKFARKAVPKVADF